jgi:hypothetical protein
VLRIKLGGETHIQRKSGHRSDETSDGSAPPRGQPNRDAAEPGCTRVTTVVRRRRAWDVEKRLLDEIIGVGGRNTRAMQDPRDPHMMAIEERAESGKVARLDRADELRVRPSAGGVVLAPTFGVHAPRR